MVVRVSGQTRGLGDMRLGEKRVRDGRGCDMYGNSSVFRVLGSETPKHSDS